MFTWRSSNFYNRCWNQQLNENGSPFPPNHFRVDLLCKNCGKSVNNWTFHKCAAKTSFCYKCKFHGHFRKVCDFHEKPQNGTSVVKKKSRSRILRDMQRMQEFRQRKSMTVFPFSGIEDGEFLSINSYIQKGIDTQSSNKIRELLIENKNLKKKIEILENTENKSVDKLESEIKKLKSEYESLRVVYDLIYVRCHNLQQENLELQAEKTKMEEEKEKISEYIYKEKETLKRQLAFEESNYSQLQEKFHYTQHDLWDKEAQMEELNNLVESLNYEISCLNSGNQRPNYNNGRGRRNFRGQHYR